MDLNWLFFLGLYLFILGFSFVLLLRTSQRNKGKGLAKRVCYKNVRILSCRIGGSRRATAYYIAFQGPECQSPIEAVVERQEYKIIRQMEGETLKGSRFDVIAEGSSVLAIALA